MIKSHIGGKQIKWLVYDIECYVNFFYVAFLDIQTQEYYEFEISDRKNEHEELKRFITINISSMFVSFNGHKYDSPILNKIYNEGITNNYELKRISDDIVQNNSYYYRLFKNEIDLFKLKHFNNKAKRTSLKTLQARMWISILDLPYEHTTVLSDAQKDDVIHYCKSSDITSTLEFLKLCRDDILRRIDTSIEFGITNILSSPDPSIGEKIILKYINDIGGNVGQPPEYSKLDIKDLIFDYISFETEEYNMMLNWFKKKTWYPESKTPEVKYKVNSGIEYKLGFGGLHASRKGVFRDLKDIDATSYYPNIILNNNVYPQQIGEAFITAYSTIYEQRVDAKNKGLKVKDAALKLSLNSVFGKLKDKWSKLYDPKCLLTVTINGQLMLLMLCERLELAGYKIIQANTDGITIDLAGDNKSYKEVWDWWVNLTKIPLEEEDYKIMYIRNVNNYGAVSTKGSIKEKGIAFNVDNMIKGQVQWHMDFSSKIIPLALREYFVNNIPIEDTIRNCKDFTKYLIIKRNSTEGKKGKPIFYHSYVENGVHKIDKLDKTIRYYISNRGGYLYKEYSDGTQIAFNAKLNQKLVLSKVPDEKPNDINYGYYISETRKIVTELEGNKNQLFLI